MSDEGIVASASPCTSLGCLLLIRTTRRLAHLRFYTYTAHSGVAQWINLIFVPLTRIRRPHLILSTADSLVDILPTPAHHHALGQASVSNSMASTEHMTIGDDDNLQ